MTSLRTCLFVSIICLFASHVLAADSVPGRIDTVTLYRGQALVTRAVPVDGAPGAGHLVVGPLPYSILSGSLFAENGQDIDIRAVRYRTRMVGEAPQKEVAELDKKIEEVQDRQAALQARQQLLESRKQYLQKLDGFVVPTAKSDQAHGLLNAESLKAMALFSFEQRERIVQETLEIKHERRRLQLEEQLLYNKRSSLTSGSSQTIREAVLFYEKKSPGPKTVRLSYLVNNAGWSAAYNIRAGKEMNAADLEYNALITQQSGEAWENVRLTLSTASPTLSAKSPGLAPFRVNLVALTAPNAPMKQAQGGQNRKGQAAQIYSYARQQRNAAIQTIVNSAPVSQSDNLDNNWKANDSANREQTVELLSDKEMLESLRDEEDEPSISYALEAPISLASRSDQQIVRIKDLHLDADFYYVASPVLTRYVFREAAMRNSSQDSLLGGAATVYLAGEFVGRTYIPTIASGEGFVVGFGADTQLRCGRELVEKTDAVQGGNREVRFLYRLSIENFKKTPVLVRLQDRLPYVTQEKELRVTLDDAARAKLSKDARYQRQELPRNILRWDVEVPAGSAGEKVFTYDYSYKLAFDRTKTIALPSASPAADPSAADEFMQMERSREKF